MLQNSVTAKQGFGTAGYVAQAQNSYFNIIQAFAYIGKFYLNTSHGGSSATAAINFITYKRTN